MRGLQMALVPGNGMAACLHTALLEDRTVNQKDIENKLLKKIPEIAKILASGKDCELRRTSSGISVISATKKVISR